MYPSSTGSFYTSSSSSITPPTQLNASSSQLLTSEAFTQPSLFSHRSLATQSAASSSSASAAAYDLATALSSSSLDHDIVYRGVQHHHEPTQFASNHSSLWHDDQSSHFGGDVYSHQPASKKIELTDAPFSTAPIAYTTAGLYTPPASQVEFPTVPSHVERFTSFYSSSTPNMITKCLRIAFQTITEMRVDVQEDSTQGKFRGQCYTDDGECIQFVTRIYRSTTPTTSPYLIEFQRRCGDSVTFFRMYQKMLKSCSIIHSAPYESSFHVSGMLFAPVSPSIPLPSLERSSSLSSLNALTLDLPSISSLCNMIGSNCIESKRESAKCLAKVSATTDLFPPQPPTLERQSSSSVASKAIWSAITNVLTTRDEDCARYGSNILSHCLKRGDTTMLLEHLVETPQLVHHLVQLLESEPEAHHTQTSEIKRQVATVLQLLVSKKGVAYLNVVSPNALQVLEYYQSASRQ